MEVLASCDQSPEAKTSITLWNPESGTKLLSLRGPSAHPASLSFIRDEGMAICETGKPFIHFWQCGHPLQTSRRILCPGKPSAMAMSPDGFFLAVAIDEKINIWQPATGRIVTVINSGHYRPVTVLKFNDDGTFMLSGAQDGMVLAWKFIALVSLVSSSPTYSWSDHSFPVSDVHVGTGGSKATVFSVAMDRTMKVYSLLTGTLILSVAFPLPLTSVVADASEFAVYVGTTSGAIYQMKLHSPPRSIEHHISTELAADHVFKKHSDGITALTISADGRSLASADESGIIHIWNLESKQPVKTIGSGNTAGGNKIKVTNLAFWLGDPENLKGGKKPMIVFPDVPKLVEVNEEDMLERDRVVTVWNRFEQYDSELNYENNNVKKSDDVTSMAEIANLKLQLAKCETINKRLHEFCVDNILGGSDDTSAPRPKKIKK